MKEEKEIKKTLIRWGSSVLIILMFLIAVVIINLHPFEINFNADEEMEAITENMMKMQYAPKVCENQTTLILDSMSICIESCKWSFNSVAYGENTIGIGGFMRDRDCADYCYTKIESLKGEQPE